MSFFRQVNAFCLKNGGHSLRDTRWYGHERQLKFIPNNQALLSEQRDGNLLAYASLDGLAIIQMHSLHEKLL